ncbi:MAG: alpha/beta hydrolase, partial [Microbacteriaceae bacterium]|nr:alpha/beta hydrolase [Microbacteriaceae bacterium]
NGTVAIFPSRIPSLEVVRDEGRGPVVVLVHGIASTAATFDLLVPLLTPYFRVVAVNLLGCGNSAAPDIDYTVDEHVESIRKTLFRKGIFLPFVLVGHSMGGIIAARFTARFGNWVKRLVLVGTPIYPPPSATLNPLDWAQLGFYTEFYNYLKANPVFTAQTAKAINHMSPIKDVVAVTERGWESTKRSMTNVIQRQETLTDLTLVRIPVDLVYGTNDPFLSKKGTTAAARLPNVTAWPVARADHLVRPPIAKLLTRILLSRL